MAFLPGPHHPERRVYLFDLSVVSRGESENSWSYMNGRVANPAVYQTRMRALEEIAELFGDKVAGHYFGATESEMDLMKREALRVKDDGELPRNGAGIGGEDKGPDSGSEENEKRGMVQHETA